MVGEQVPDFELVNQDGQPVKLSDFKGKRVILFAFPKANTPGCTAQACGFRDEFPRFEGANAVVLGISADDPQALKRWKDKHNLPYDLLSDPDHVLLDALGVWNEKSMFGNKFFGITRSHWVIDADGKIEDAQVKVGPQDSVKKAIKQLGG